MPQVVDASAGGRQLQQRRLPELESKLGMLCWQEDKHQGKQRVHAMIVQNRETVHRQSGLKDRLDNHVVEHSDGSVDEYQRGAIDEQGPFPS